MLDIRSVADVAHENGVPLIVDNTIATPYLIKPFEHGADIIVHSATKFLGGHGTVIGGVIVDGGKFEWSKNVDKFPGLTVPDPSYHGASYTAAVGDGLAYIIKARVQLLRDLGAAIAPQSAWLLIQGIETLSLRIERHVQGSVGPIHSSPPGSGGPISRRPASGCRPAERSAGRWSAIASVAGSARRSG